MKILTFKFVDYIPENMDEQVLYISLTYKTAIHKCCCGCGKEVVTPISPTDWKIIYDGETISLSPSIGNWSFDCKSHYWIRNNKVVWAERWTENDINKGRINNLRVKEHYYNKANIQVEENEIDHVVNKKTLLRKIFEKIIKLFK